MNLRVFGKNFISRKKVLMPFSEKLEFDSVDCHRDENFCCESINDELAVFVHDASNTYQEALKTIGIELAYWTKEYLRIKLFLAYYLIYTAVVDAFTTISESRCAGFCCETASTSIAKIAASTFALIAVRITLFDRAELTKELAVAEQSDETLTELVQTEQFEEWSPLKKFIFRQLALLGKAFGVVLATMECPLSEENPAPCFHDGHKPCACGKTETHKEYSYHRYNKKCEKESSSEYECESESESECESENECKSECESEYKSECESECKSESESECDDSRFVSILHKDRKHGNGCKHDYATSKHYHFN